LLLKNNHSTRRSFVFGADVVEKYHFDESTATHLSSQPLLRDPYEAQYCYTKRSTISEAGDGLFARRDVPDNFVIAFYNGFRLPIHQIDRRKWEQNQYTLQIDDDVVVDLDPYHSKTSHYCATLGHKANCLIGQQANAKYDFYYHHPRYCVFIENLILNLYLKFLSQIWKN